MVSLKVVLTWSRVLGLDYEFSTNTEKALIPLQQEMSSARIADTWSPVKSEAWMEPWADKGHLRRPSREQVRQGNTPAVATFHT